MTDGVVSLLSIHLLKYLVDEEIPSGGRMHFNGQFPCYRLYQTKDGKYMTLAALEKKFWENFCYAIGRTDLINKQYDDSNKTKEEVESIFKSKTRGEWEEIAEKRDSCLEPVLNFKEVMENLQLKSRNLFFDINRKNVKVPQIRIPFLMSGVNDMPTNFPPIWGEHTEEILTSIGYNKWEIDSLRKKGVIS
jgi:crotonobetainyl-CoA:carnitine CoA-transferase CaiB-like acyl-CoA transferase